MDSAHSSATSPTLLGRLRQDPADGAAWSTFVLRYGPRIHAWCRQWRLQEADAQDVTQDVLIKLVARMRTFTYDASGSFRGWLKTVTYHAWRDALDGRQRAVQGVEHLGVLVIGGVRDQVGQRQVHAPPGVLCVVRDREAVGRERACGHGSQVKEGMDGRQQRPILQ